MKIVSHETLSHLRVNRTVMWRLSHVCMHVHTVCMYVCMYDMIRVHRCVRYDDIKDY